LSVSVEGLTLTEVRGVWGVKAMDRETEFPFTVRLPEVTLAVYPGTVPTENEYVPFGSLKVIVLAVE
jgi:hypothetical protein